VFKGFHKGSDGVGKWGGRKSTDADNRIKELIHLEVPVWNTSGTFTGRATRQDINTLINTEFADGGLDLVYLDPPYNQHPYGSNYFMLNLIASNVAPDLATLSRVSGIPNTWNRSEYNYKKKAQQAMSELIAACLRKSAYVLISYNDEGIISDAEWTTMLEPYEMELIETEYNAYRGSRNLAGRRARVMERMYLVSAKTV
jgi:adenine-specific DNA-methyltransferase